MAHLPISTMTKPRKNRSSAGKSPARRERHATRRKVFAAVDCEPRRQWRTAKAMADHEHDGTAKRASRPAWQPAPVRTNAPVHLPEFEADPDSMQPLLRFQSIQREDGDGGDSKIGPPQVERGLSPRGGAVLGVKIARRRNPSRCIQYCSRTFNVSSP